MDGPVDAVDARRPPGPVTGAAVTARPYTGPVTRTSLPDVGDAPAGSDGAGAAGTGRRRGGDGSDGIPSEFHPAVAAWFRRRFPAGATEPQRRAWPRILTGEDVLVASPTGSGKTLTGFLVAIDAAYRARSEAASASDDVSPPDRASSTSRRCRALAVDVEENLRAPLEGIAVEATRLGLAPPQLTVAVRTGDTPAAERAAMRRHPPDLLVTTPESLYLLLTAASSRAVLRRRPHGHRRRSPHPGA